MARTAARVRQDAERSPPSRRDLSSEVIGRIYGVRLMAIAMFVAVGGALGGIVGLVRYLIGPYAAAIVVLLGFLVVVLYERQKQRAALKSNR